MPSTFHMDDAMLWDEILKAIVDSMPEQLFPLFKEVFGKEYPPDASIMLLATEQSTFLEDPGAPPGSRFSDIALLVNGTDYYHLECQMHNDGNMAIRMVVYDLHFATQHSASRNQDSNETVLHFPRSAVIYPEKNLAVPDHLQCRIVFQDGSNHLYQVPTVRIQSYSLSAILEKHLDLFIPYLLLRLRPRLKNKHPLTEKELTDFVKEVILLLETECKDGYISPQQAEDYARLFQAAAGRVFAQYPDFRRKVLHMTKPLITLPSVKYRKFYTKIHELESRARTLEDQTNDLQARLESKQNTLDSVQNQLDSAKNQLDSTKNQLDSAKNQLDSTKNQLHSTKNQLHSTKNQLHSTKNQLDSAKAENAALRARLMQLSQASVPTGDKK